MELFPAIDLRAGAAVRLTQGDFDREQRYGDPDALAARYIAGGARWIHVVDLDAARTGVPHERAALRDIVGLAAASEGVRVQAGGGIRSEEAVAEMLESGVERVVLGTAALEDPDFAVRCARRWPRRIAVGLDYRVGEGGVAEAQAHGWLAGTGQPVGDLLARWEDEPFGAVVATAVARDGMLAGPDLAGLGQLLAATALPLVASGGVSSLGDLAALASLAALDGLVGLDGLAVGRVGRAGRVERWRAADTGRHCGQSAGRGPLHVEEGVAACAASG